MLVHALLRIKSMHAGGAAAAAGPPASKAMLLWEEASVASACSWLGPASATVTELPRLPDSARDRRGEAEADLRHAWICMRQ